MAISQSYGHYINGEYVAPESGEYIDSIDPHDGSLVTKVAKGTAAEVDKAVKLAKEAQKEWKAMRPLDRGEIMIKVSMAIEAHADELANADSREMGAPVAIAATTIPGTARYWRYYGGLAPSVHGEHIQVGPNQHSYTMYDPYGVVGVITPWNAPLNQAARSIAPALAVGNAVVHKPSEFTSASALIAAEIAVQAGLPKGIWNVVTGYGADVGNSIVEHPGVGKVAFTGSVRTGQAIGRAAAEKIMPVTLELGGKSPDIVFEDANLQAAIPGVMQGFLVNSGQVCLAGTRVLVQRTIYDQFCQILKGAIETVPVGRDNEGITLGPIANKDQFEKVQNYFEVAKQDGATLLTGGSKMDDESLRDGYYIKPTAYRDVDNNMRIAREEIFGPVGVIIPFDTEEEAIDIANDSEYGLAGGVWTENLGRAHRVAEQIESGQIYVNSYLEGSCEHPLGGYKKSGIGREKGEIALRQYAQVKNIVMNIAKP